MRDKESLFRHFQRIADRLGGDEEDLGRVIGIVVLDSAIRYDRVGAEEGLRTRLLAVPSGQDSEFEEMREMYAGFRAGNLRIDQLRREENVQPGYSFFCELKEPRDRELHERDEISILNRSTLLAGMLPHLVERRGLLEDRLMRRGVRLYQSVIDHGPMQRYQVPAITREDFVQVQRVFNG